MDTFGHNTLTLTNDLLDNNRICTCLEGRQYTTRENNASIISSCTPIKRDFKSLLDLNLQEKNCFTIHEPRDVGEDCPPNFTIVVQNIYCHQQVPLAKVLFCDHREIPFPLEGNGTATTAATLKYKELLQQLMAGRKESPMVQVTKEVTN